MRQFKGPWTKLVDSHQAGTKLVEGRGALINLLERPQGACEPRPSTVFHWSMKQGPLVEGLGTGQDALSTGHGPESLCAVPLGLAVIEVILIFLQVYIWLGGKFV